MSERGCDVNGSPIAPHCVVALCSPSIVRLWQQNSAITAAKFSIK
jgi:hypothetical protein